MRGYRKTLFVHLVTATLPFNGVTAPSESPEFEWPTASKIAYDQSAQPIPAPTNATAAGDSGFLRINGAGWMPSDCKELKVRLLTLVHDGTAGHRGSDPTPHAISEHCTWTALRDDVRLFVAACPLCVL